jgi:hypothetical protein
MIIVRRGSVLRTEVDMSAVPPPRLGLGSTAWVMIVAVLLVVFAAVVFYLR